MSSISETDRREALNQIAAANREMAERAKAPGYYHWTLGLLVGGIVAAQEAPYPWMVAYYPVFLRREMDVHGACLAASVLVAVLVTAQGYLWEKAYRSDLGVA